MPEATTGWFPVFTLVLGYATKTIADWLQHRRATERERQAREAARLDQLSERRTTFQRQTLLDLQESMMQLVRTVGAMHYQDVTAFRKSGIWQRQWFDEALSENHRLGNARTSMLAVRVRDESVRQLVKDVKNHAYHAGTCETEEDSEHAMTNMVAAFEKLNQRTGEILRTLDDEPYGSTSAKALADR